MPKRKKKEGEQPAATPPADPANPADATPAKKSLKDEGRDVFGQPGSTSGSDGDKSGASGGGGWSIVLETYQGDNAQQQALSRVPIVSGMLSRTDLAVRVRDKGCALVMGSYKDAADERAQRDLAMLRQLTITGTPGTPGATTPGGSPGAAYQPYPTPFLIPPLQHDPGDTPEFDLGKVKAKLGAAAAYTLQVAVYETPDKPDQAKRAAEQAAKVLREQGEKAFYYHGPRRSMVTIGVFTARDYDEKTGRPLNPEIGRLQQAYPLNLLNGQYPVMIGKDKKQPSMLVKVP